MKNIYIILFFFFFTVESQQAFAQGCDCTNCPVTLPDVLTTTFTANLTVQGATNNTLGGNNTLQQVCVNITHDWIGDLDITLVAPDGTQVVLFGDGNNDTTLGGTETCPCGNSGDDMVVCFVLSGTTNNFSVANAGTGNICNGNQSAYVACNGTGAQPCYTGNWLPYDANCNGPDTGLSAFNNGTGTVNGNWQLVIHDNAGANQGVLNDFYLVFANETGIDCNSTNPSCPATAGATDITPPLINTCAGVGVPVSTAGSSLSGLGPQACIAWGFWVVSDPLGAFPGLTGLGALPSGGDPANDPNFVGYWDLPGTTGPSATMPAEDNGVTYYVAPMTLDNCNNGNIDANCFDVGTPVQIYFNPPIDYTYNITCQNTASQLVQIAIVIEGGHPSIGSGSFTITDNGAGTPSPTTVANGGTVTVTGVGNGQTVNLTVTDNLGCTQSIIIGPINTASYCPTCGVNTGTFVNTQTGNGNTSSNNGTNSQGPFILCWGDLLNLNALNNGTPPPPAPCSPAPNCYGSGFVYTMYALPPASANPFDPATSTGWGTVDNYNSGDYIIPMIITMTIYFWEQILIYLLLIIQFGMC